MSVFDASSDPVPWLRLDPLRRAGSPCLKARVQSFIGLLEAREAELALRDRRRDRAALDAFRLAAEAIACGLIWSTLDPLGRPLAVPRGSGTLRGKSRYRPACYGRGFTEVLSLMARPEIALVEDGPRGYHYPNGDAGMSTIRPTAAFISQFVPPGLSWRDFARAPDREVLVLKAPKAKGAASGEPIEYDDTDLTRRLRGEVQRINRNLEAAPFWFDGDDRQLGLTRSGELVDPSARSVRRIFNNGRWTEGGRLFGGAWQTLKRADRFQLLRMGSARHPEGERVANVDLVSLNPVLAYSLAELPVPVFDLYNVRGELSERPAFKVLMSAMLFADRRLTQLPAEARKLFPPGTATKDVVAAVERYHAPIAHRFWCGYGHRLANIESAILIEALAGLERQGVPALPLHDSVLVPRSAAETAKVALEAAFSRYVDNHRAAVKIDYGTEHQ